MAKRQSKPPEVKASIAKRAAQIEQKLRKRYEIGRKVWKGKQSVEVAAQENGLSFDTVRKLRLFAERYTAEELDELCTLPEEGRKLPLHFGYVIYLLAAQSAAERASLEAMEAKVALGRGTIDREAAKEAAKEAGKLARAKFADEAKKKSWTAPQLYAAVVEEFGLKPGHHGRAKVLPQDPRGASQLAIREIEKWCENLKEILLHANRKNLPNAARSKLNSRLKVVAGEISRIRRLLG